MTYLPHRLRRRKRGRSKILKSPQPDRPAPRPSAGMVLFRESATLSLQNRPLTPLHYADYVKNLLGVLLMKLTK